MQLDNNIKLLWIGTRSSALIPLCGLSMPHHKTNPYQRKCLYFKMNTSKALRGSPHLKFFCSISPYTGQEHPLSATAGNKYLLAGKTALKAA